MGSCQAAGLSCTTANSALAASMCLLVSALARRMRAQRTSTRKSVTLTLILPLSLFLPLYAPPPWATLAPQLNGYKPWVHKDQVGEMRRELRRRVRCEQATLSLSERSPSAQALLRDENPWTPSPTLLRLDPPSFRFHPPPFFIGQYMGFPHTISLGHYRCFIVLCGLLVPTPCGGCC
jgi:hypothetical protein